VKLDHLRARLHDLRELEHGDARGERIRGERGAKVVDAAGLRDRGRGDGGLPDAPAEVVEVDLLAVLVREQERRREARR
jgi:hypothetical protein